MKKIQWLNLWTIILKTRVSFISATMFITLGVGLFLGLNTACDAVNQAMESYFDRTQTHDFSINNPTGFTDKEMEALNNDKIVEKPEWGYSTDVLYNDSEGLKQIISTRSLQHRYNHADLIDGRLPEKKNEVAVDEAFATEYNIVPGDTITLDSSISIEVQGFSTVEQDRLVTQTFNVTGIVDYALYSFIGFTYEKGFSGLYQDYYYYYMLFDESAYNTDILTSYTNVYFATPQLSDYSVTDSEYGTLCGEIEDELNSLADPDSTWVFENRINGETYNIVGQTNDVLDSLSISISLCFLIIGVLVCYTTVMRVVAEQSRLIGAQKALGFFTREIRRTFTFYTLFMSLLGSVLGTLLGFLFFQPFASRESLNYVKLGTVHTFIDLRFIIITVVTVVVVLILATTIACNGVLKVSAIRLLSGDSGKKNIDFEKWEKNPIWRKLSLYGRSLIINLVQDKGRVLSTLISVAGATALIIGPITVLSNMNNTPEIQFSQIFHYNYSLMYDDITFEKESQDIFDSFNIVPTNVMVTGFSYPMDNGSTKIGQMMIVEDPKDIQNILTLHTKDTGELIELCQGQLLAWGFLEYLDEFGDDMNITITPFNSLDENTCKVDLLYESYGGNPWLIMTAETYKDLTGQAFEKNTALFSVSEKDADECIDSLQKVTGFRSSKNEYQICLQNYKQTCDSVGIVGYLGIGSAVILGILVLLNLESMFITEKKKELIIMRINGFSVPETRLYIYRDNIILTVFGTFFGVAGGIVYGKLMLLSLHTPTMVFLEKCNLWACLAGIIASGIFAFVTNAITLRPIAHWKLMDINN